MDAEIERNLGMLVTEYIEQNAAVVDLAKFELVKHGDQPTAIARWAYPFSPPTVDDLRRINLADARAKQALKRKVSHIMELQVFTSAELRGITRAAAGSVVFDSDLRRVMYYNGSGWIALANAS
jgi:hypothetical protein